MVEADAPAQHDMKEVSASGRVAPEWTDALLAAALLAVDPPGLGGAVLRANAGPVRDRWMEEFRSLISGDTPLRRVPSHTGDERLLGGLDLAATLKAGRPVLDRGILADVDGGVLIVPMAERMAAALAARLVHVMDRREVAIERDGIAARIETRFGVIALDEGIEVDERAPAPLMDRLAFHLDLSALPYRLATPGWFSRPEIETARQRLSTVVVPDSVIVSLCTVAVACGIGSLRAPMLALAAARAAAALDGRDHVSDDDATLAARLVFAPRANQLPAPADDEDDQSEPPPPDDSETDQPDPDDPPTEPDGPLEDRVLDAVQAAIPAGLLDQLKADRQRQSARTDGARGSLNLSTRRGRPIGALRGMPGGGKRLSLVDTLRAAAPWQPIRKKTGGAKVAVRSDDFRVRRFKQATETLTIFAVDASGSTALNRLAETKGAIELLLSEAYSRRDQVALVAFRGAGADLLLPPTRALARAKRALAGLPGGGGTPLALGLDAALALALDARRRGQTPTLVLLTDGSANIARDGTPGRKQAASDARESAARVAAEGIASIVIDTSNRPAAAAETLAGAMAATYLPLPRADAGMVSNAVKALAR